MSTPNELEQLQDGLNSEFWRLFVEHKQAEWGVGGARYEMAVRTAAEKQDEQAIRMLQMVLFARTEIERLFQWPQERVGHVRSQLRDTVFPGPSRRGPGL